VVDSQLLNVFAHVMFAVSRSCLLPLRQLRMSDIPSLSMDAAKTLAISAFMSSRLELLQQPTIAGAINDQWPAYEA